MDREQFGRRFKAARTAAGLTQGAMADQLGISRPRIAEYEAGRRIPTVTRLYEMIDALGLDYAIFFPEANRRHR